MGGYLSESMDEQVRQPVPGGVQEAPKYSQASSSGGVNEYAGVPHHQAVQVGVQPDPSQGHHGGGPQGVLEQAGKIPGSSPHLHHPTQQGAEEKSTWFMPKEREDEEEAAPPPPRRRAEELHKGPGRHHRAPGPHHQPGKRNPYAPVAPLFIPRTQDGALVRRMREMEEDLAKLGPKLMPKLKMVEQGGLMLKHILTNSNPWKDRPCNPPQCSTCQGEHPGTCRILSVVYSNTCLKCKDLGKEIKYIGESARTMLERSKEHQRDALASKETVKTSHMRDHTILAHGGEEEGILGLFRMDLVKTAPTALERQIREAVEIRRAPQEHLLNLKEEYNRCLLF